MHFKEMQKDIVFIGEEGKFGEKILFHELRFFLK